MRKWLTSEQETRDLEIRHCWGSIWQDKNDLFWFNDETQADLYGPYQSSDEAAAAAKRYADEFLQ